MRHGSNRPAQTHTYTHRFTSGQMLAYRANAGVSPFQKLANPSVRHISRLVRNIDAPPPVNETAAALGPARVEGADRKNKGSSCMRTCAYNRTVQHIETKCLRCVLTTGRAGTLTTSIGLVNSVATAQEDPPKRNRENRLSTKMQAIM